MELEGKFVVQGMAFNKGSLENGTAYDYCRLEIPMPPPPSRDGESFRGTKTIPVGFGVKDNHKIFDGHDFPCEIEAKYRLVQGRQDQTTIEITSAKVVNSKPSASQAARN